MNQSLRICLFGNQANMNYRLGTYLRQSGLVCELYRVQTFEKHARNDPAQVDAGFSPDRDTWFHALPEEPGGAFFRDIERSFDVVFISGISALRFGRFFDPAAITIICHTTGPMNVPSVADTQAGKATALPTLQSASLILTAHPETFRKVGALGLADKVRFQLPLLDVDSVHRQMNHALYKSLRARFERYEKIFGWLSRNITDPADDCYKGTELFLEAGTAFVERHPDASVRFVFGNHGPQAQEAAAQLSASPLAAQTDTAPHLDYPDLLAYMAQPNFVLFDNLAQGTISSGIFRDAMSLGTILVRKMVDDDVRLAYGSPSPVIGAHDGATTLAAMHDLLHMSAGEMGQRQQTIRAWGRDVLHWEARIGGFIDMLREPVLRRRLAPPATAAPATQPDRDIANPAGERHNV